MEGRRWRNPNAIRCNGLGSRVNSPRGFFGKMFQNPVASPLARPRHTFESVPGRLHIVGAAEDQISWVYLGGWEIPTTRFCRECQVKCDRAANARHQLSPKMPGDRESHSRSNDSINGLALR